MAHSTREKACYKIVHQVTHSIQLPSYILPTQFPTRQVHQHHFVITVSSTLMYQESFVSDTLKEWTLYQPKSLRAIITGLSMKQYN